MFSQLMTGLPAQFKGADKGRVRVLALHVHSLGCGVQEAIEMACRRVEASPGKSVADDLASEFWLPAERSTVNDAVLEALRQRKAVTTPDGNVKPMPAKPMFIPNGDSYNLTYAGVFYVAAESLYGDWSETTSEGIDCQRLIVEGVLKAATEGGYQYTEQLRRAFEGGQIKNIATAKMVQEAVDAAGSDALKTLFAKAGFA